MKKEAYILLRHKPQVTKALVIAIVGSVFLLLGIIEPNGLALLIGIPAIFAWLPAIYQSGLELDLKNRRFREYSGNFGNKKGEWISVSDQDYVSIVGIHEQRTTGGRATMMTVHGSASKVFFIQNDWHLELYKSSYSNAKNFAEQFAKAFNLDINDVNKDQNIKTGVDGFPRY